MKSRGFVEVLNAFKKFDLELHYFNILEHCVMAWPLIYKQYLCTNYGIEICVYIHSFIIIFFAVLLRQRKRSKSKVKTQERKSDRESNAESSNSSSEAAAATASASSSTTLETN